MATLHDTVEVSPDHIQDSHNLDVVQSGCRVVNEMGKFIQLICCDDDIGLSVVGNVALTLRSWCECLQQVRADKVSAKAAQVALEEIRDKSSQEMIDRIKGDA